MLYQVVTPIVHNNVRYNPGETMEAHPTEIQQALEVGAVVPEHLPYSSLNDSEEGNHD